MAEFTFYMWALAFLFQVFFLMVLCGVCHFKFKVKKSRKVLD